MKIFRDFTKISLKPFFKKQKRGSIIYVDDQTYSLLKKDYLDDSGRVVNLGMFLDGYQVLKFRRE